MENVAAITAEFIRKGYRTMSLEEKWSLALKILSIFGGIYITSTIAFMGYCTIQIDGLKVQIAQIQMQSPPAWFMQKVDRSETEIRVLEGKIQALELSRRP